MDGMARRRIRIRKLRVLVLLVLVGAIATLGYHVLATSSSPAAPAVEAVPGTVWPAAGQAAFVEGGQTEIHAGPRQHAAPIASVAKVMTAYLVLRDHPLGVGEDGPTIPLTDADVADTERRSRQRESVVPIVAGEELTER